MMHALFTAVQVPVGKLTMEIAAYVPSQRLLLTEIYAMLIRLLDFIQLETRDKSYMI